MNLLLLLALFALVLLLIRTILVRAPRYGKPFLLRLGLIAGAILVFALAISGRLHWLFALVGGLLPFIGRLSRWLLPLLRFAPLYQQHRRRQSQGRQGQSGRSQQSQVHSQLVQMTLDHESGTMRGSVLAGPFAGRSLDQLSLAQLRQLYETCLQQDPEGVRLLDAYIQRHRDREWQQSAPHQDSGGPISDSEALAILGLEAGASKDAIVHAHKRLIARLHPDKGGSNYLASKINQAKEQLLNHKDK